jgi:soluble lytic murein transglycosylase-like protein
MIAYAGTVVRLRDAKGLHYLAHLLRHPGRDWHVFDLAAIAAGPGRTPADGSDRVLRSQSAMSSGPDVHAKRAYAQRLAALRDEVEDAEDSNDNTRAAAARDEIALLTAELGRAYRLGAPREPNEPLEKARKAVSNRLRAALARLDREHPVLGRHLTLTVRIGTYCSYRPEQPPAWQLD